MAQVEPRRDSDLAFAVQPARCRETKVPAQADPLFRLHDPAFGKAAALEAFHPRLDRAFVIDDQMTNSIT
ncbi:hypothetical protein HMP06_1753 [Sphingomonas sp. HMP6]|nr:hypothetical protein HMP06_1753 [Sphingomonas sp. HMP6]